MWGQWPIKGALHSDNISTNQVVDISNGDFLPYVARCNLQLTRTTRRRNCVSIRLYVLYGVRTGAHIRQG